MSLPPPTISASTDKSAPQGGNHGPARLVTEHARIRMQQRGIPQAALEVLLDYGREAHDHRGCVIVLFDKQARRRLANEMARQRVKIPGRWLDAYAVIAEDAAVVTVGHRQR